MQDEMLNQEGVFFKKAYSDLRTADRLIELNDPEIDKATILFHLQQAVEKFLKALLSKEKIHFEKVHDLTILTEICTKNNITLPQNSNRYVELNPFAVAGRYGIINDDEHINLYEYLELVKDLDSFIKEIKG